MEKTRRYLIEVKDVETGAPVLTTAAAWDAQDKRVALLQILRLAGAPLDWEIVEVTVPEPERGSG
jgi:hypothetical protein